MSKYYYDDAVKALYMFKAFGIKVNWQHSNSDRQVEQNYANLAHDIYHNSVWDGKYYVHPDCHSLFKTQAGDLVKCGAWAFGYIQENGELVNDVNCLHIGFINKGQVSKDELPIIQRNGKAFFMPEIENN